MLFTFECFYSVLDGGEDALNGCIGSSSEGEIVQADQRHQIGYVFKDRGGEESGLSGSCILYGKS